MRINLLDELSKKKAFTIEDAERLGYTNKSVLKVILSRLEKKGWIERIEKGKYIVIPLGAEKGKYTLHEFVLGSYLVDPCVISYWSALNYYGFTEQIPRTVFIQTTSRKKHQEVTIFGITYKIIRVKEEKIFGIEKAWFEETQINLTNREKTIIDCLDKPQYAGGIIEVAKAVRTDEYDKKILAKYAKKNINLEKSLADLEALVEELESGDLPLDKAMKKFEEGIKLTRGCQAALKDAEQKSKFC